MANLNKTSIPTALPSSSHLDLSCDHVTTMDFGQFQPVHYRHPIKGEHLNLSGAVTVRPFPLACPTFGRMRCNIHHFFVPWRVIFPQYESFYNDTIAVNYGNVSLIEMAPSIGNDVIANLFVGDSDIYKQNLGNIDEIEEGTAYDYVGTTDQLMYYAYRLSTEGKFILKILNALGYEIDFDLHDTVLYSALPLLAYAKIFIDYYANQAYLDSEDVLYIKQLLAYNDPVTPLSVNGYGFARILSLIRYCQYEQDYYVGAWDNPFAPSSNQYSAITFQDVATGALIQLDNNGTPVMLQNNASVVSLGSQYLHDALKAITDYSKRHQLAGATNINRTLAQYGMGVQAMKLDRALHLAGSSVDINTGAVYSTVNNAESGLPSTLGDYAGNGYGNGTSDFDFRVEELGIQITIASIIPSGGYYQGMDENNMHVHRFDFFTPEMDGLATQILRRREVYVSRDSRYNEGDPGDYDKGFAHTGRYGEYKRPRSWVSGDFRCPTRFMGSNAWHLMREITDKTFGALSEQVHSLAFTRYLDAFTYRRIFAISADGLKVAIDNDPFYAEFHWAVGSYAPCHGLFDNYEFETEGNKKVTLESNGAVVN